MLDTALQNKREEKVSFQGAPSLGKLCFRSTPPGLLSFVLWLPRVASAVYRLARLHVPVSHLSQLVHCRWNIFVSICMFSLACFADEVVMILIGVPT